MRLKANHLIFFIIFCGLSVFTVHNNLVLSGFETMHGDLGDSRLLNLYAEHAYRYLTSPWSQSFWSPTWQFFPVAKTFAYSDVFIGATGPYLLSRAAGFDPFFSFQLWWLSTTALNFVAFFYLARLLGFEKLSSSVGAYCFAAGLPVISYLGHPQLLANYWTALFFAFFLKAHQTSSKKLTALFAMMAAVCLSLQFWSSVYLGWFVVFGCSMVFLFWLSIRRRDVLAFIRRHFIVHVAFTCMTCVMMAPLLYKYGEVLRDMGGRSRDEVLHFLPVIQGFLFTSDSAITYQWLHNFFKDNMLAPHESYMFVGLVPLIALGSGIYRTWSRVKNRHILPTDDLMSVLDTSCTVMVCIIFLLVFKTQGGFTIWRYVLDFFPGASAIRAVGRISIFLMLPLSILLCLLLRPQEKSIDSKSQHLVKMTRMAWVFAALAVLETGNVANANFTKKISENAIMTLAQAIPNDCPVFYSRRTSVSSTGAHLDAMWASILTEKPTINGYSGFSPPGYGARQLDHPRLVDLNVVKDWLESHSSQADFTTRCLVAD
jgi:hypothetical protein